MATTWDVSEQRDPERFYEERSAELVTLAVQEFGLDAADARRARRKGSGWRSAAFRPDLARRGFAGITRPRCRLSVVGVGCL